MIISPLMTFVPDAKIVLSGACATKVLFHRGALDLSAFPDPVRRAIGGLVAKPASQIELAEQVREGADPTPVAWMYHALGIFAQHGLLSYMLEYKGAEILTLRPMACGPLVEPLEVAQEQHYRLSRFVHLRRDGERLMIESPVSATRIWVASKTLAGLLFEFDTAKSVADLTKEQPVDLVDSVFAYLLAAKVITACNAEGNTEEDRDPVLRQWEFHDMTFHAHTRVGRHHDPLGAHFPFEGVCPPPPALKAVPSSQPILLFRPRLAELPTRSLSVVMEQRQSWRYFDDDAPITAEQLGTFLYRTARVRAIHKCEDGLANRYDQSSRPYPSGGAMYELELYVTVRTCDGLEPGIYYYDPLAHGLHHVSGSEAPRAALLNQAAISAGGASMPQVLITMTSRFERMSWKYNAIAYGTTLKHVGVLMGMMCLVASDMDLAACALGSGLAELAPGAIDIDFFQEAPVGDLMLGSRGTPPAQRAVPAAATLALSLPEQVQSFMQDPSSMSDPSPLYSRLLEEAPIYRTSSGAVLISSYQDVSKLISHPLMSVDHSGKAGARGLAQSPEIAAFLKPMMSMRNPPSHNRIAAPMRASFKCAAVNALRTQIDALVDENLRPHLTAPSVDIVSAIAKDLPVQVTCTMLGIPREDWPQLQIWTELLARQLTDFTQPPEKLDAAVREVEAFADYIRTLLAERLRVPRGNDILTDLLAAESCLSEQELIAQCMLVLIGGRDTVTNMISNSVHLLLQYPLQFAACRQDPSLIPTALEECLRFESPIRMAARSLTGDLDYGAHRLKQGDTVLFLIAAANRDPAHFLSPNSFDTAREPKLNMSFGRGTHFCIGQHFARVEGASVLHWLLQNGGRIEQLDTDGKPAWENNLAFRGLSHLNVRMHPGH